MTAAARSIALVPLSVALTAAAGYALCGGIGHHPLTRNVIIAAAAATIGAWLGLVPLRLVRGADQAVVAQASLVGMTVQLIATLAAGVVPWFAHMGVTQPVLWWLMAFYAVSLVLLVLAFVQT